MLKHRSDIDGLRCVAVLPVVLFHAGLGFPGGFVGVDVFFVISGYLITSIILKDVLSGAFSLARFWERRIRRIVPAMAVVTFASLLAGWFWLMPSDLEELGKVTLAQVGGVANIYLWMTSGYFSVAAELMPFLHYWSLAVEEQYYLVLPLFLILLGRFWRTRIFAAISLLLVVSFVVGVVGTALKPSASFYLLPTRAWELLVGSFLASWRADSLDRSIAPRWVRELAGALGFATLLVCFFVYDSEIAFPGIMALPPVMGAAMIIWGGEAGSTWVGRALSLRPLLFVGLVSYSLYLWHWPVMVFYRHILTSEPSRLASVMLVAASFVLAVLSWKYVEAPFRKPGVWLTRKRVFGGFAAVSLALLVLGCVLVFNKGFESRVGEEHLRYRAAGDETEFGVGLATLEMLHAFDLPALSDSGSEGIDLLLWGDSHGGVVSYRLAKMCEERGLNAVSAYHFGIIPLVGYETTNSDPDLKALSLPWNEAVLEYVREKRPRNVLLAGFWARREIEQAQGWAEFANALDATVGELAALGVQVWILRTVPIYQGDLPKSMVRASMNGARIEDLGLSLQAYREQSESQDKAFESLAKYRVNILDPEISMVKDDRCLVLLGDAPVYFDNTHLTRGGSVILEPVFKPMLDTISRAHPGSGSGN